MTEAVVPVWTRQLAAIQHTVQGGTVELLTSVASILGLQDQLSAELKNLPPDAPFAQALKQLNDEFQQQCEHALMALQFGDRVVQMVDILYQDTERFALELPGMQDASPAEAEAWLNALESRYTTDEQRQFHRGEEAKPPQDNVEFF
ncbi:hypothetical protein DBR47_05125 [Paucibacter sp. KBW04]|nr:hypothetical protein DBR47_05125 [Paucibacter sp. KBW04]